MPPSHPYAAQKSWQRRFYEFLLWANLLKGTIVTGTIKEKADRYLAAHGRPNDFPPTKWLSV